MDFPLVIERPEIKVYKPHGKIEQSDLMKYYSRISSVMLPYLKDRPQSLHLFPEDVEKAEDLICNDEAALLNLVTLGCVAITPWNSAIHHPDNPDWMVINLQGGKSFKHVVKVARETRKLLDKLEISCYCKTSGASGLHIYIPLEADYQYEHVRNFAELIVMQVNRKLPATTYVSTPRAKGSKKVYLDFRQNEKGAALAAPYSVLPQPGAPVSTPLEWKEVNGKLNPMRFTMKTIFRRIDKKGDVWKPVMGKGANLHNALFKLITVPGLILK